MPDPGTRQLTAKEIARLRVMYAVASKVRGFTPLDDPARQTGRDLAATYASLIDGGVSAKAIARALDCSLSAVVQRLYRHGYRPLPPSMEGLAYKHVQGGHGRVKAGVS